MIYTVTLNPSLDFITDVDDMRVGGVNQSSGATMSASGLAINISQILRSMHVPTLATGFIGGQTGAFIEEDLKKNDIPHEFVHIEGTTRINFSIFDDGVETRILGEGPEVSAMEINELMFYLSRLREGDMVIIAGSLPPNAPLSLYQRIIEIAMVNQADFIPVIPAELLLDTLDENPLIIAPDLDELSEIFHTEIRNKEDALPYALKLIDAGAENVIINLKREGSLFVTSDKEVYSATGPNHSIISATYTNIALISGFVGHYMRTSDPVDSFKMAQAAANATYYVRKTPDREQIENAYEEVEVLPIA